jgi:hypothetical protein
MKFKETFNSKGEKARQYLEMNLIDNPQTIEIIKRFEYET